MNVYVFVHCVRYSMQPSVWDKSSCIISKWLNWTPELMAIFLIHSILIRDKTGKKIHTTTTLRVNWFLFHVLLFIISVTMVQQIKGEKKPSQCHLLLNWYESI